ncbi:alanine:cation symporter family protein [Planococcus faecalis]|uniref:alanine:cation symporter family protein n=1 Tax=Planococcus faecalis TaxID=1598147 RepID=UPI000AC6EA28|nr:alanine:cation symporter family protein [Planococcus faecalis]
MSGLYKDESLEGAALTTAAFEQFLGSAGPLVVAIGLIFFASSTIIGWSYYGEKCFQYLFKIQHC